MPGLLGEPKTSSVVTVPAGHGLQLASSGFVGSVVGMAAGTKYEFFGQLAVQSVLREPSLAVKGFSAGQFKQLELPDSADFTTSLYVCLGQTMQSVPGDALKRPEPHFLQSFPHAIVIG